MLMCNKKCCIGQINYPLRIKISKLETKESEYNVAFIINMIPKLDWKALCVAANDIGVGVPPEIPENVNVDESFLTNLHKVLLDIHIVEGELICPTCNRSFPVTNGIPNMLLTEDEI